MYFYTLENHIKVLREEELCFLRHVTLLGPIELLI